ncbi:MAG: cadmium-translocating P-type ATPase [Candidatus Thermoplasmatota archaeon]|nr:cadmium-translocating P-type ATPase [Candidatus Thermoplasmatota archaeon]
MTCATCAQTIEKSLKKLGGVTKAQINLGTETASIEYNPTTVTLTDLNKAVTDAGYEVINEKTIIKIGDMTCAMCVKTIEDAIKKLDGVINVQVNLSAEKAYITYNPNLTSIAEFKKTIESLGYHYLGVEGDTTTDQEEKARTKSLTQKRNRIIIGFSVSIPLMALMYLPLTWPFPMAYFMLIVSTPAFIYISYPIFIAGYHALRNTTLNMDVMYSMGIGVAYTASIFGTFQIVLTREFLFYETAVMLATFLTLGRYLETQAKGKTSDAIKKLIGLQPKTAHVIRNNQETDIPIEDVQIHDTLIVKPGEKIPVDGIVIDGESYVDESMISGEPIPVLKKKNIPVIGGTLNQNGVITITTEKIGKDTMLSQIITLVQEAQGSKPPVQRIADKAVAYFIPIVLTIAIASFLAWYFIFGQTLENRLLFSLSTLISVLVVACPCALGLATPTAVTVGLGRGAELGVLIKKGEALELPQKLTTIIFDKTGTLTKGKPDVTDIIPYNTDENTVLQIAASIEQNATHPLAKAIVQYAQQKNIRLTKVNNFNNISGKGVIATIKDKEIIVGNRSLFSEKNIPTKEIDTQLTHLEAEGKTAILISQNNKIIGIIAVADTIKDTTKTAITAFKNMGLHVIMITGDNKRTANAVAKQLGIDTVLAEVLPQEKAAEVKKLQQQKHIVAFVGDGINDAPALAQADVGIAIGSGTDIALESGEIVLVKNDLLDAVAAIQLSKKVMTRIKQNIFWAFAYNTALIPVAAGILYPFYGITFRPELAGLAMAMSSVTVITLSLLLKNYIPPIQKKPETIGR